MATYQGLSPRTIGDVQNAKVNAANAQAAVQALRTQVVELERRFDLLRASLSGLAPLYQSITSLEAQVAALAAKVEALESRLGGD